MNLRRDRHFVALLAVLSSGLFGFAARVRIVRATLAGDEPHYLIFNVALEKYHSLNVMPVYRNRDYWSFYPALIEPHVSAGPNGPLPLHSFGAPLLWHSPYLVWGEGGAIAFMATVSVLTVINIFYFLRELGIVREYAGLVATLFAIGSPIYVYSSMLFVEPIAALAVLYAVRVLFRADCAIWRLVVASAGLGVLPWVHGRFTVFTVLIGGMLAWRAWQHTRSRGPLPVLIGLGPLVLLLVGLFGYNLVVWHSLSPAPGNAKHHDGFFQIPAPTDVLGVFFDRSFGLVSNFPLMVLVISGVALAARRDLLRLNAAIAIAVLPYLLAVCAWSQWWGAYSPPARFLAAIAPLLSYYVAVTLQRVNNWLLTVVAVLAGLLSFALGVTGDVIPALRWNVQETGWVQGQAMVQLGELIGLPFSRLVPSSFLSRQGWTFAAWTAGVAAVAVALWFAGRRGPVPALPTGLRDGLKG